MPTTSYLLRLSTLLLTAMAVVSVLVLLAVVVPISTARADTTFTVKSKADTDGTTCGARNCTLRQAINAANTTEGNDTIVFDLGRSATIKLGSQLPEITDAEGLTIDGRKAKITVSGNDAVRVFQVEYGAVFNLSNLTVADGNSSSGGAGLLNRGGEVQVLNSTFFSNSASGGGGIYNESGGPLEVTNSTFSNNSARYAAGILATGGTTTVTNSTFSNNKSSKDGGAIYHDEDTLTVTNSTFSKNSASGFGGGILNSSWGPLEVTNSTFSKNSAQEGGGSIFQYGGETTTLKNTILANSPSGGNCVNWGTLTDGGYNIDDGTTCGFSEANNSMPSTNPRLDLNGLQKNGGPTKTIKLLKDSPAIDTIPEGENGCATEITTDQRGVSRPQGSGCDIGAYEKKVRSR